MAFTAPSSVSPGCGGCVASILHNPMQQRSRERARGWPGPGYSFLRIHYEEGDEEGEASFAKSPEPVLHNETVLAWDPTPWQVALPGDGCRRASPPTGYPHGATLSGPWRGDCLEPPG